MHGHGQAKKKQRHGQRHGLPQLSVFRLDAVLNTDDVIARLAAARAATWLQNDHLAFSNSAAAAAAAAAAAVHLILLIVPAVYARDEHFAVGTHAAACHDLLFFNLILLLHLLILFLLLLHNLLLFLLLLACRVPLHKDAGDLKIQLMAVQTTRETGPGQDGYVCDNLLLR